MAWNHGQGEMRQLQDVPPEQVDQLLALLVCWQVNGKDYEPNTLDSHLSAVKDHLRHAVAIFKKVSKVMLA